MVGPTDAAEGDGQADPAATPAADAIPLQREHVSEGVHVLSRADRAADAALVKGLAVDDPAVAAAFVRRFQGAVFGLAVAITRDSSMAEDVSQEVFVRAWRAAGTYDIRRASVLTWLLTITRNAAIDATRMRRATPMEDEILESLVSDSLSVDDAADSALRHLDSEQASARLRTLPPEQARAVVLAVICGCTAVEVSEREHIPLGTAKTRIRSGLRRLRDSMKEDANG